MQWEYYETNSLDNLNDISRTRLNQKEQRSQVLNELGKEGWEIVSVISRETSKGTIFSFFFKRPKQ